MATVNDNIKYMPMVYKTVYLPLEEAIELAVKENMERDIRLKCVELCEQPLTVSPANCSTILTNAMSVATYPDNIKQTYVEEARELLETTGRNYNPEFNDHHYIHVLR